MSDTPTIPDTNVVLRYLLDDEPALAEKAKAFFDKVKRGEADAIILESVVAECVYVLSKHYEAPRERIAESLIAILRYKGIANSDQEALIAALSLYASKSLHIVDCILYAKAAAAHGELMTFDKQLTKLWLGRT